MSESLMHGTEAYDGGAAGQREQEEAAWEADMFEEDHGYRNAYDEDGHTGRAMAQAESAREADKLVEDHRYRNDDEGQEAPKKKPPAQDSPGL